jgi:uncharacterized protein with HEPN domain
MIDAAEAVQDFVAGRDRTNLDTDRMMLFAIVRAIEIIGEAASKISPETLGTADGVPWAQIIATRNRLVHGDFDIDHGIVWKTATEEIPNLLSQLRPLIAEATPPGAPES